MKEIQELIRILPHNDPIIAGKLLAKRDWNELSLLVASDIIMVEKAQRKKNCPPEYIDIPLDKLMELKFKVDEYNIDLLYGEE